jgi:hypothetical protein
MNKITKRDLKSLNKLFFPMNYFTTRVRPLLKDKSLKVEQLIAPQQQMDEIQSSKHNILCYNEHNVQHSSCQKLLGCKNSKTDRNHVCLHELKDLLSHEQCKDIKKYSNLVMLLDLGPSSSSHLFVESLIHMTFQ